jgi:hypothetical protein
LNLGLPDPSLFRKACAEYGDRLRTALELRRKEAEQVRAIIAEWGSSSCYGVLANIHECAQGTLADLTDFRPCWFEWNHPFWFGRTPLHFEIPTDAEDLAQCIWEVLRYPQPLPPPSDGYTLHDRMSSVLNVLDLLSPFDTPDVSEFVSTIQRRPSRESFTLEDSFYSNVEAVFSGLRDLGLKGPYAGLTPQQVSDAGDAYRSAKNGHQSFPLPGLNWETKTPKVS